MCACKMHHLEALKANLGTPATEVRRRVVERITKFDEHVQRHEQAKNILAARIVNQGFDNNECTARRQGVVSRADEMHLLFKIPVVEYHAHRDDVGFGQRIFEEIATSGADAITEPGRCNVSFRDRLYRWQVERNARKMRMLPRNFNTE